MLPALRGAGFCSGPELLLKWSFLNNLKGLYEVVPPVASESQEVPQASVCLQKGQVGKEMPSQMHFKQSKQSCDLKKIFVKSNHFMWTSPFHLGLAS